MFWIPLALILAFLGGGSFLLLFYFNVILKDVAGERHWALPIFGGVAIAIGLICLLLAIVEGLSRKLSPYADRITFVLSYGLALVVVTTLAATCTWAAIVAWQAESAAGARLSGGITGSIYEHRIVWTLAAAVLDLLALVVWLVAFLGSIGALIRKRQT
jgi:hypothetical protein